MSRTWKSLWREECGATPPVYRILVPDSVPSSVVSTWLARGYRVSVGSPAPTFASPAMSRNLIRSNFVYRTTAGAGLTATGLAALPTAVIALAGDIVAAGVVTTGVFGAITAVTAGWTGLKYRRDPKRLSKKDKEAAAAARWITPTDLGWIPGLTSGQDTDEQRLFHLAVTTARRIAQTRAWTHPILQDHVARVDLDHAVASIGTRLQELVELRSELESVREPQTSARIDTYLTKLATAFRSMADRVVAMHEYYEHLLDLDRQLTVLAHTEQSKVLGDRVLDVLSRTADDESADWRFRELNIEAESHADVIKGLLSELEETAEEFDDLDDLDRRLAQAQQAGAQKSEAAPAGAGSARGIGSSTAEARAADRDHAGRGTADGVDSGRHSSVQHTADRSDRGPAALEPGAEPVFDLSAELRRQAGDLQREPRD